MVLGRARQSILTPRGDFHFPRQFNRLSLHAYAPSGDPPFLSPSHAHIDSLFQNEAPHSLWNRGTGTSRKCCSCQDTIHSHWMLANAGSLIPTSDISSSW